MLCIENQLRHLAMTSDRLRYLSEVPTDHWVALLAVKTVRDCEDVLAWLNHHRPELSEAYVQEHRQELSRTADVAQKQVNSRIVRVLEDEQN